MSRGAAVVPARTDDHTRHRSCFDTGVGLDFNTQLVEAISKVKGANYFSVHTPGEFRRRLVDDFDFAVT